MCSVFKTNVLQCGASGRNGWICQNDDLIYKNKLCFKLYNTISITDQPFVFINACS